MNKEIDQALKEIIKLIIDENIIQPIKKIIRLKEGVRYLKQPKKKKSKKLKKWEKPKARIYYGYNTNK